MVITGNLSLTGKVGLVIKPLNGTLAPGTYTLITYTGTLTGNVSNFAITLPAGIPYTLNAVSGAVTLTVPVTRAPAAIVWRGSGGSWDLAASQNWLKAGSPDVFVAGDTVTFDDTVSASPTGNLSTFPTFTWQAPPGSNLIATFSTATAAAITMTLAVDPGAGIPVDLIWSGATNSTWDTYTLNWTNSGNPAPFQTTPPFPSRMPEMPAALSPSQPSWSPKRSRSTVPRIRPSPDPDKFPAMPIW